MDYLACRLDLSLPGIVINPSKGKSLPHVECHTKIPYAGLWDKALQTGAISTITDAGQDDSDETVSE